MKDKSIEWAIEAIKGLIFSFKYHHKTEKPITENIIMTWLEEGILSILNQVEVKQECMKCKYYHIGSYKACSYPYNHNDIPCKQIANSLFERK